MLMVMMLLTLVAAAGVVALRVLLRWRDTRLVRCPETGAPAAVHVDLKGALLDEILGRDALRLRDCSRWPERAGCGQECLAQVEAAPGGCRVRAIVTDWYRGRKCAYCARPFGELHWHDHPPALRTGRGMTRQWNEVHPEDLPSLFATCLPVCWDCHVAESFRREHLELVVDRESHHQPPRARRAS